MNELYLSKGYYNLCMAILKQAKKDAKSKKINMMWIGFLTIRMYLIYARIILNCTGIKKLNYTS